MPYLSALSIALNKCPVYFTILWPTHRRRALFREDRRKCARLVREKKVNTERIETMRAVVKDMLLKKFGRQVSVAKLESLIIDPHVVELRQDQMDFGLACAQELKDWNVYALSLPRLIVAGNRHSPWAFSPGHFTAGNFAVDIPLTHFWNRHHSLVEVLFSRETDILRWHSPPSDILRWAILRGDFPHIFWNRHTSPEVLFRWKQTSPGHFSSDILSPWTISPWTFP